MEQKIQSCYVTSLAYILRGRGSPPPPPPLPLMRESSEYFPADVCRTGNFFFSLSRGGGAGGGDVGVIKEIVISGGASTVSGRVYAQLSRSLSLRGRQTLEEILSDTRTDAHCGGESGSGTPREGTCPLCHARKDAQASGAARPARSRWPRCRSTLSVSPLMRC